MKYTLEGFSQEAALSMRATITEDGRTKTIKLDIVDLNILRWIVDFYPAMKKVTIEGSEYVWLDYETFVADMPLLGLSKQSLYKRCVKMVQLGVLKHKTVRNKGTYSYYGFGPEYQRLIGTPRKTAQAPTAAQDTAQDPWAGTTNATAEQFQQPAAEPEPLLNEPQAAARPKPKKTRKAKSFDDILDAYTSDPTTKELLGAWLQNRKAKRSAMTGRAIQGNIDKLDECAQASHMNVNDYLNEVIRRGWGSFFPIDNYRRTGYQQPKPQQQNPWYDTPEAQQQYDKDMKEWEETCVFRL